MVENTTNNYLKKAIEQIEQSNDDLNESVVLSNFIFELKMSNLLIPGIDNGDELVYETLISEDDDSTFLPLFTDSEEFFKHYDEDSEYEPIENEFEIYAGISADESLDGIIINVESESFEVTKDLLEIAEMDYEVAYENNTNAVRNKSNSFGWWLRSANSNNNFSFTCVCSDGGGNCYSGVLNVIGVSPAFRIS